MPCLMEAVFLDGCFGNRYHLWLTYTGCPNTLYCCEKLAKRLAVIGEMWRTGVNIVLQLSSPISAQGDTARRFISRGKMFNY